MSAALEQSGDAASRALHDEIGIWLEGRSYAAQEAYLPARTAYDLAISLNNENPATHFERSLTATQLDDPQSAISDLIFVWQQGPQWEQVVVDAIGGDDQIRTAMWRMNEPPPFISFFPLPLRLLLQPAHRRQRQLLCPRRRQPVHQHHQLPIHLHQVHPPFRLIRLYQQLHHFPW